MSAVLDAIKKSQRERSKQNIPILRTESHVAVTPSKLKPIAIIVVVIAILVALFFVIQKTDSITPNKPLIEKKSTKSDALLLKVNAVSYSLDKTKRLAMINGKIVKEGDDVLGKYRVYSIKPKSLSLIVLGENSEVLVLRL